MGKIAAIDALQSAASIGGDFSHPLRQYLIIVLRVSVTLLVTPTQLPSAR